ncbi:MAG: glucose PTS transporter subunit IIA [Erysipelotrichaceae bacterium]|nr:glucose PTS transporter subunit IIA [Erysipelotrichaceae bacterium]
MALDYRKCAEEIFSHLGGKDNIASAAHCATRLRLAIVDNSKVDVKALENTEGVQGVFSNAGQLQIIIGTGTVNKVYDEFIAVSGVSAGSKDDVKAAAAANMPWWKRIVKTLGDVFVPILPAIVAAGLMMGLVEALGNAIPTFHDTAWFGFLDMAANTAFAFLPVLVAISATKVFGGNEFLGAVIGLMMVHPALTNGWNAANGYEVWYLFGQGIKIGGYVLGQINQLGYQGHVIPVVISIWLMCKIEKYLHEHVPEMIDLFVTPLATVLVTALLTFMIIGPIFSGLETIVLNAATKLVANPIGACAMGALYPFTVVMGLHHMYNTIELGMLSSVGLNTWMPIASAANFAQFGACLAVGLKARSQRTKAIAIPSSLSASLGITEPAIFGVNMRYMKPFICGAIGGAIGSLFGAIFGIGAHANGVTGIPGYLIVNNYFGYTVLLLVAGGIAFALTMVLWKEDEEEAAAPAADTSVPSADAFTTGKGTVTQPVAGKIIPASEIADPVFAAEGMGPSVGIVPTGETVYAPFDGEVMMVFPTKHAIGLTSTDGIEVLIHVGIDTVNMNGTGFEAFVEGGQKVSKGDKLLTFDRAEIKKAGYSDTVIVVLTNGNDLPDVKKAA